MREILALSYYDLPYPLKPCFLYLGNFPEDSEIYKSKIIQLWIAEGFIQPPTRGEQEETLEDIAEQYLRELIHRCMVQVSRRDYTGVGVKTCRMHDLMRDLCMLKAREENFSEIVQQNLTTTKSSNQQVATTYSRRIAISPGCRLDFNTNYSCTLLGKKIEYEQIHPRLRSLLCFGTLSLSALTSKNFSVLRVLEIKLDKSMKMPGEIGNLIHLKYLCLNTRYSLKLPNTIGNLRNLHTLDIHNCPRIMNLPREIFKLVGLRHLLLPSHVVQRNYYYDASRLTNIVTLKYVPAECLSKNDALLKLTNLQNLGIVLDNDEQLTAFLRSPYFQARRLRSLNIRMHNGKVFSLEPLSTCHSLSKLTLRGTVWKEVDSNDRHILQLLPANLNKLVLWASGLKHDPMTVLEKLSNLRFLKLGWGSYQRNKLVCSAGGFPKLETLQLVGLTDLKEWHVEEGALQSLKRLDIQDLIYMKMMPDGLRFVTSLKELNIKEMKNSFCERLHVKDGIEGADFYKVARILSISISNVRYW